MNGETEKRIHEMHGMVREMHGRFSAHVENKTIHQVPPCKFQRGMVARMWAAIIVAFGAICTAAASIVMGGK